MYYLAVGDSAFPEGRYLLERPFVARDTTPHLPPDPLRYPQLPAMARSYQRLNAYRWAIPQVHTALEDGAWLLLEDVPLTSAGLPWPSLRTAWSRAGFVMQVGWLLQITRLWDPCLQEDVASSLLDMDNIGVQGWQIRIFYLNYGKAPTLAQLGKCWLDLPMLAPALQDLAQKIVDGQYTQATEVLADLEALVTGPGKVTQVIGLTHPGQRANNEDTFYYEDTGRYGVVCDGMGGHEGGEIASGMALDALTLGLNQLASREELTAEQVRRGLADAVFNANTAIYELNLQQGRSRYRKMGTTVVAGSITGSLLHIAHVGDSRIYLISRQSCQQLTVDDDVANLEVSLARATQAAVVGTPNGGALTQALGIVSTTSLQPTVQTFVLSEDCLVVLCSDGLCDGGLVERTWQTAFLPLLDQDITQRAHSLIELALKELGHDNITFVLFKYQTGGAYRSATDPGLEEEDAFEDTL